MTVDIFQSGKTSIFTDKFIEHFDKASNIEFILKMAIKCSEQLGCHIMNYLFFHKKMYVRVTKLFSI